MFLDSEVRVHTNQVGREWTGCLIASQWTWPGQRWSWSITPVLTWMTRGKGNKGIKRGGQGEWEEQNDRQSIILVKMLSPHCTFTFHQVFWLHTSWRNAPQGSLQLTLTVHRSPQHRLPALPCVKPTSQHVHLSPTPICILSIIWGGYLSTLRKDATILLRWTDACSLV